MSQNYLLLILNNQFFYKLISNDREKLYELLAKIVNGCDFGKILVNHHLRQQRAKKGWIGLWNVKVEKTFNYTKVYYRTQFNTKVYYCTQFTYSRIGYFSSATNDKAGQRLLFARILFSFQALKNQVKRSICCIFKHKRAL